MSYKNELSVEEKKIKNFFQSKPSSIKKANFSSVKKTIFSLINKEKNHNLFIQHEHIIQKQLSQLKNLIEAPSLFLNYKPLKNFESAQILIHEKGIINVRSLTHQHGENKTAIIPVAKFNKIYQTIQKSKTKLFNQMDLDLSDLDIMGPFLAKNIELKKYKIIIIISRNEFLYATEDEFNSFNYLCSKIAIPFENILNFDKQKQDLSFIKLCLDNLPSDLKIDEEINQTDFYHLERISLLGELLNTLKHELMNPLFGISLSTSFLVDSTSDTENISFIKEISKNATRCQDIINNFSTYYENDPTFIQCNLKQA